MGETKEFDMSIIITNQLNEQECGVCALTSLHNHYYKFDQIEKEQVLDNCNLSTNGMSIFDFEICANKVGLECESYEVKWSEFISLKLNSYFVLLLATDGNNSNHYVIAKKHKHHIEIYDSCSSSPIKLNYSDLKNKYLNIVILLSKKSNKTFNSVFSSAKTLMMLDLKFIILNIVLSILILAVSIIGASFLNWIIDAAIVKNSIKNLLTVSFIFIFIYLSNNLLTYITTLYSNGHLKSYFLLFTNKILSSLQIKKLSFLNKVDKSWIYKIDECVFKISNFCIVEINKLITNIIFSAVCIIVIGVENYWLLIFCLIIPLVQFIFFLFSYRKKKSMFTNVVRTENKNASVYKDLIYSLSNEHWNDKKNNLVNQIKLNYSNIYKNFNDATMFKCNTDLFKSILRTVIEIALVTTMSVLIINSKSTSIGILTFIIAAFGLYSNSTNSLFQFFLSKIEFDVYWQVYKDITEVDNLKLEKNFDIENEIKTIDFIVKNNKFTLTSNKDNTHKLSIINLLKECESLSINNQAIDHLNINTLDRIIICDENSNFNYDYFIKQFELRPELYAPYLRYFQINLNNQTQSFYNRIVLNLLSLFNEEKRIIIFDSILDIFPTKDKLMIKDIVNKIQHKNYVFINRKEGYD